MLSAGFFVRSIRSPSFYYKTPVSQSHPVTPVTDIVTPAVQDNPGEAVEAANLARVERPDEAYLRRRCYLSRSRYAHN